MPLRVLIVPDKFKGTLTAGDAARAIARGWRAERPRDRVVLLPMSDGGDGFGEILAGLLAARAQTVRTVDAAHRPLAARWWWEPRQRSVIIESASIIGLARLPRGKFHPFALDTFGLGAVLRAAARKGARRFLVGIGGSATNDGGFGLARALGWRFLASNGSELEAWTDLRRLSRIEPPDSAAPLRNVVVAVDVQNLLLGPRGCTRIYGPQKGLRPGDFAVAEAALRRLTRVVKQSGMDVARVAGAGAAGGLGFGLMAFAGAKPQSGFEIFAKHAGLTAQIRKADLVITGEGSLDASTMMGKGVGEVARRCKQFHTPCLGLAGRADHREALLRRFAGVWALLDQATEKQARGEAARCLADTAAAAARGFQTGRKSGLRRVQPHG